MVNKNINNQRRAIAVPVIIALNIIVFICWNITDVEPMFMLENFTVSWDGLSQGRYWTLLSSAFSHNMIWHIFLNMFVLRSFGSLMERILGITSFLKFYLSAAIFSSICHAVVSAWILHDSEIPALGASGAISGVILVFALMFPKERIYIFGILPLPALWGAFAFIGLDVWGLIEQAGGGGFPIGHGAHIGGALAGIIYYFMSVRPRMRSRTAIV